MTWWSLRPDLAVCTPCSKFGAVVCVDAMKGGGAKWPRLPPPRCTPLSTPRRRTSAGVSLIAAPRGRLAGGRHDGAGDNATARPSRIGSTLQAGLGRRRRSSAQRPGQCERTLRARDCLCTRGAVWCSSGATPPAGRRCGGTCVAADRRSLPRASACHCAHGPYRPATMTWPGVAVANRPLICSHRRSVARCRVPIPYAERRQAW